MNLENDVAIGESIYCRAIDLDESDHLVREWMTCLVHGFMITPASENSLTKLYL